MGHKSKVRPGLSSPDPSQDVEFTLDKQIDDGQHERDEKEEGGALGPAKEENRLKSNRQQLDVDEDHATPDMKKGHRGTFP
ncbi:MAG: hypothetical protein ACM3X0_03095 [Bacteroidota bacterium]